MSVRRGQQSTSKAQILMETSIMHTPTNIKGYSTSHWTGLPLNNFSCVIKNIFKHILFITGVAAIAIILVSYYGFLDRLYLVDEVLSGDLLRELSLSDKFTIRLGSTKTMKGLSEFIGHYSICPSVHEIQIIWHSSFPLPDERDFQFTKTHSKVTFVDYKAYSEGQRGINTDHPIDTDSLLLLDADVFVACRDLRFAHSVWRSSRDSLVGFFPRTVKRVEGSSNGNGNGIDSDGDGGNPNAANPNPFHYGGISSVAWHMDYNLLLPAGVIMAVHYITTLEASTTMHQLTEMNPQCSDMTVSLWATHKGAAGPIWVDVPVHIRGVNWEVLPFNSILYYRSMPMFYIDTLEDSNAHASDKRLLAKERMEGEETATETEIVTKTVTGNESPSRHTRGSLRVVKSIGNENRGHTRDADRSYCVNKIAHALDLTTIPSSHFKSTLAVSHTSW